ncbi:MAG: hypothetical protein JXR10_15220 [Cyclobacteriaceae bacterium]
MIPKRIFYTYTSYDNIPSHIRVRIENYKKINPDFTFEFYSDDDIYKFISENYPELLKYYEAINETYGAARADFFRYLIVYHFGGYYMDHKLQLNGRLKNINIDNSRLIISFNTLYADIWNEMAFYTYSAEKKTDTRLIIQYFFAAEAKHPLLWIIITNMIDRIKFVSSTLKRYPEKVNLYTGTYNSGAFGTHWTTGPILFNDILFKNLDNYQDVKILDNSFNGIVHYHLDLIPYIFEKVLMLNKTYHMNKYNLITINLSDQKELEIHSKSVSKFKYLIKKFILLLTTSSLFLKRYTQHKQTSRTTQKPTSGQQPVS